MRGLKKYFPIRGGVTGRTVGFVRAVDGVDLKIRKGKTLGLIGESGCGKTTVGRCILQLLEPTFGEVLFRGVDIASRPKAWGVPRKGALTFALAVLATLGVLLATLLPWFSIMISGAPGVPGSATTLDFGGVHSAPPIGPFNLTPAGPVNPAATFALKDTSWATVQDLATSNRGVASQAAQFYGSLQALATIALLAAFAAVSLLWLSLVGRFNARFAGIALLASAGLCAATSVLFCAGHAGALQAAVDAGTLPPMFAGAGQSLRGTHVGGFAGIVQGTSWSPGPGAEIMIECGLLLAVAAFVTLRTAPGPAAKGASLRLAGVVFVVAAIFNILVLMIGVLGRSTSAALVLPDAVTRVAGAVAPWSATGLQSSVAGLGIGDDWTVLGLVGVFGGVVGAAACFEAYRVRPALIGGLIVVASFQWTLGLLALGLVLEGRNEFGKDSARSLRKDMQIVFQDPFGSLNPRMLVSRVISEPLRAFRDEIADRYPEHVQAGSARLTQGSMTAITTDLIARVGLNPEHLNRFPHEFSGGQRQRICVARALALKPAFIVLDEPTSALDVSVQAQILNLLKEIQKERGLTYLFISHHLAVIRHMCDDIAVMYLGKIVEKAPNEAIFTAPMHPYTIALLSAIPSVDPEMRRERIVLEGEIPSPANPPTGCRFHTRCNFAVERETVQVAAAREGAGRALIKIDDPLAVPSTVRVVVDDAVIDPLAARGTVAYEAVEVPGVGVEIHIKEALKEEGKVRVRYRRYRESCVTVEPHLDEAQPGHSVACHFWKEALEAGQRAEKEGKPVGAVVAEMRAPLPPKDEATVKAS